MFPLLPRLTQTHPSGPGPEVRFEWYETRPSANTNRLVIIHLKKNDRKYTTLYSAAAPVQSSVLSPGAVMARLSPIEAVSLRIATFLLAREAGAEPGSGGVLSRGAVALAGGPGLLVVAPVRL